MVELEIIQIIENTSTADSKFTEKNDIRATQRVQNGDKFVLTFVADVFSVVFDSCSLAKMHT